MLLTENSNQWTGVHSGRQTTGNVPFPTEVQHNRDPKKKEMVPQRLPYTHQE